MGIDLGELVMEAVIIVYVLFLRFFEVDVFLFRFQENVFTSCFACLLFSLYL